MNTKPKQKFLIFLIFLILLSFSSLAVATKFFYVPMEEIPGFGRPDTYESYLMAIYKFGLWTVGISAVLMISIGAFMYITSAGNTSQAGKAKGIIFDAIAGVILALISYVLLNTINPALVNINAIPQTGSAGVPGTSNGPAGTTAGYKKACPDSTKTTPIDFSGAKSDTDIKLSSACDKYDFSNNSGVDPCILRSMAQMESSCGANKGPSGAGACGLMQILEETASALEGRAISCAELKSDDALSIKLAAKYISQNSSSTGGEDSAIFAGYNSGYGCPNGKKHALCNSSDCSGAKAYECCVNPGGLDESINYAWNGVGLYNQCKNK